MIKILFVNHSSSVSGAEKVLMRLISCLDKALITVTVICPENRGLADDLRTQNTDVIIIPMPLLIRSVNPVKAIKYCFGFYRFFRQLLDYLRIVKPDIIHCNSFTSVLYSFPAARYSRIPLVWHMHDILEYGLFNKLFIRLAGFASQKVICVSNAVKENLVKFGVKKKKCMTIYNSIKMPIDQTKCKRGDFLKEFGVNSGIKVVTMIGQIAEWKGQSVFINALEKLMKHNISVKSFIVGDVISPFEESYRKSLQQMTEDLDLNDRVFFTGFRKDIQKIINDSDVIVHASIRPDPLPTVIIEAMSMGKPIVATNVGGVPELIEHEKTGLMISPLNSEMLSEAISNLLDNPRKAKFMGDNAKNIIDKIFNPRINLLKILNIYYTVLPEDKKLHLARNFKMKIENNLCWLY